MLLLVLRREKVDQAMKRDARHDMDEKAKAIRIDSCVKGERCSPDNFIHGVEYERVAPHDYGNSVVAIS